MHTAESGGFIVTEGPYLTISQGALDLGITNYMGSTGGTGVNSQHQRILLDKYLGIFGSRSKTKLSKVTDGLSKTLLFGETMGLFSDTNPGDFQYAHSWMGAGAMPVIHGYAVNSFCVFNSRHHVVQFCFADGSLQALSDDVSEDIVKKMAGMRDGELYEKPNP